MLGGKILVTCEHAGNYIPKDFQPMFRGAEEILASHRGWDPGALAIAKYMARQLTAPLYYQKVSRLLIEVNRSLHHRELFSEFTQSAEKSVRSYLLDKFYHPYRNSVEERIRQVIQEGYTVIHLSIHSFTPVLNNVERAVDIGLLYDENRTTETLFCNFYKEKLYSLIPEYLVMLNCPYNGADDGFTTYLRTQFSSQVYLGIEIEINQKYVSTGHITKIKEALSSVSSLPLPTLGV